MMKLLKRIILILFVATIIAFTFHLYERLSYAPQEKYFAIGQPKKDTIPTIGIIGDSWVSYNKLDTLLANALLQQNIRCRIISSGKDGARTKQIYQSIFKDDTTGFSCKSIIEQQPELCIIIAGVNDAQSFTGAGNYAHHMILMIKTLVHYNIRPVIVTLPQFDVEKAQQNIGVHRVIRNKVSALVTNERTGNIPVYRLRLQDELKKQNLTNSIILVDFDKLCIDYKQCSHLYRDALHLSGEGNRRLCRILAEEIATDKKREGYQVHYKQ